MTFKERWRRFEQHETGRWVLLVTGVLMLILAPIVGLLPGPGGLPLAAAGLTLVLRYASWSKRLYVRAKRRWPKQGALLDRGLRRASARRRREIAREQG